MRPVLSVFDGKTWRAADRPADAWRRQPDSLRTDGRLLRYELTLEPLRIPVLPLLEMSDGRERSDADIAFKRGPDLQWQPPAVFIPFPWWSIPFHSISSCQRVIRNFGWMTPSRRPAYPASSAT